MLSATGLPESVLINYICKRNLPVWPEKISENWMAIIISRNRTTHTYDEKTVIKIVNIILEEYVALFNNFKEKMLSMQKAVE
ncbi:nucleotidyltransferase substrate binding protein [Zunongwangia sp. H14]|uniref:nucleotidyltransferase substrate binding protein n=1 Tax=Zunongwangia sp. H14 TaxID=3240792 RepID=UPI00356936E7